MLLECLFLTLGMLCASVHPCLIFCEVFSHLSVLAVTCCGTRLTAVPPSFLYSSAAPPNSSPPSLLFLYAPVPLNSLSGLSLFFLLPPILCMCLWMRLSHVMDIFSRKSQRNQRQRAAASSRIAACAFPSFPLFSSFCSFFLSHKKEMLEMRFPQPLLDNSDIKWRTNGDKTISCCFSSCPRCAQNFVLRKIHLLQFL